jgi:hypothetical protein
MLGSRSEKACQFADFTGLGEQGGGDDHAARRRDGLQPDREVHAAAVDIVEIEDDRLPMDADPKCDTALGRLGSLACRHFVLQRDGAADRVERALEHGDKTVAGIFHDLAVMGCDGRVSDADAQGPVTRVRFELGRLHQACVTDHVGHQNSPKAPLELRKRVSRYVGLARHRDPLR